MARIEMGFSGDAREAVLGVVQVVRALGHESVDTEHLLLGLILEGDGVAAEALREVGIENPEDWAV